NTARFLHRNTISSMVEELSRGSEPTQLNVRVLPAIRGEALSTLVRTQGDLAINRFLRHLWMESLPTDDTYINGMIRPMTASELIRELVPDQRIFPPMQNCGKL